MTAHLGWIRDPYSPSDSRWPGGLAADNAAITLESRRLLVLNRRLRYSANTDLDEARWIDMVINIID
jgi:hypothetical protein